MSEHPLRTATKDRLDHATAHLDPPVAVIDLPALDANVADLLRRAAGKPIRLASKSIRSRAVLERVHALPGFAGVLGYTVAEAIWLSQTLDDIVVAYPSAERNALRELAADERARERVTLMVDSPEQLDLIDAVAPGHPELQICLDLDASLRAAGGRVHIGTRRSAVFTPADALRVAREIDSRNGFRLTGIMSYEGQVAGLGNRPPGKPLYGLAVTAMQTLSVRELAGRRAEVVAAVNAEFPLRFVNAGGTGSLETSSAESAVTELTAGSGLYGPGLFDGYRHFRPAPAALFGTDVVRRPGPGFVTVTGGGWIASGPVGHDREPIPAYPQGLSLIGTEGAGEVQTPLKGAPADGLAVGDRVWFRHAKAGELAEHVATLHLVAADGTAEEVPTYRGEGKHFL
ncbi:amino acid deaminase/aldolase [Kineosporia succinea]|uniref:D-serine deaminase-like pyridoxal phosphate-dependent protein n=1 Tax=Kineosporia succinea TaxID=84632 RepID=A0ABT9NY12_9ACTN|nr:amino acid deaminase/aldolase [Kineosporia succinea]MDP9825306.1 D-serine deaminase-like pyridoxal phosphate-dependent protein [Kineosporia succinea]